MYQNLDKISSILCSQKLGACPLVVLKPRPLAGNQPKLAAYLISESDVAKYGDPYSELVLCIYHPECAHTRTAVHTRTHTPQTYTRSSGQPFMLRRPGNSWGFGALLKGTSVGVERVLDIHSLHLQFLPNLRLELATFGL